MPVFSRKRRRILLLTICAIALLGVFLIRRTHEIHISDDSLELMEKSQRGTSLDSPPPTPKFLPPSRPDEAIEQQVGAANNAGMPNPNENGPQGDANESLRRNIHYSSHLYSGYQQFVDSFGLVKTANTADLNVRCSRFFKQLSDRNPDWKLQRFLDFNDEIHDTESLMDVVRDTLRVEWEQFPRNPGDHYIFDDDEQTKAKILMDKIVKESVGSLHEMDDTTAIMRVMGRCFFNDDESRDFKVYNEYTKKLFPFFSGKLPKYFRGDSDTAINNGLPIFDAENNFAESLAPYNEHSQNLIEFFRANINGRGIVISATDKFKDDLVGLIRVLRATNNRLPIQIVHLEDLSSIARDEILRHAKLPIDQLLQPRSGSHVDGKELLQFADSMGLKFPPQEIWFVDVLGCVTEHYRKDFSHFYAKLLAYFFNSFSEILYMDADAVPLVTSNSFFTSKEYQKSGTYFFRDRAMQRVARYINGAVLLGLSPMNERSIENLFDIPLLTAKTTGNLFFQGWFHLQEAGVVLIDRKKHFLGTLMPLHLAIWNRVIRNMVYGDKELYWLGLAIAGDENYEFNAHSAAAAGTVYIDLAHAQETENDFAIICSSHPAHVNDDGKLLWVNSGFQFCKKNGWQKDRKNSRFDAFTDEEMRKLYTEPPAFQGAVVPPDPPAIWAPGLPYDAAESARVKSVIEYYQSSRPKDHLITGDKKVSGLKSAWTATDACSRYEYCASSKVISYHKDQLYDHGKFYAFSAQDTELYKFYGKVWMYPYT